MKRAFTPLEIKSKHRRFKISLRGFMLIELLLAGAILAFVLSGLLSLFVNCIILNESNRNLTLAYSSLEVKMEEMKNAGFSGLNSFNGVSFDLAGFSSGSAKGKISVGSESSRLKSVSIVACYMNRNRLIGNNINNCQVSQVKLTTLIAE